MVSIRYEGVLTLPKVVYNSQVLPDFSKQWGKGIRKSRGVDRQVFKKYVKLL